MPFKNYAYETRVKVNTNINILTRLKFKQIGLLKIQLIQVDIQLILINCSEIELLNEIYTFSHINSIKSIESADEKKDSKDENESQLPENELKFVRFAEKHRAVLNQILRQSNVPLSDGPFSVLTKVDIRLKESKVIMTASARISLCIF